MKRILLPIIFILCCIGAEAGNRKADSLSFCGAKWQITELKKGAEAAYAAIAMFDSQQSISVIRYPARRFSTRFILSPGKDAAATSKIATDNDAYMAVNAGYFSGELLPCVHFRIGKEIHGVTNPAEAFRVNGVVGFRDKRGRRIMIEPCHPSDYQEITGEWHSVMASGPMLMNDGRILVPEFTRPDGNGGGTDAFDDRRHPRTVIGHNADGDIFLIVIDGRHKGKADGTSMYQTALICSFLGLTDAINLDGGGSSSLWTELTGVLSHPSDNRVFDHKGERRVPYIIGVF